VSDRDASYVILLTPSDRIRKLSLSVEHIHTYLVHPGKGSEAPPQIGGAEVPLAGKLFSLLDGVYAKSDRECNTDISFNPSTDGKQQNPCRDLILKYLSGPTIDRGRHIAERLEKATTHRSGLGLLFLIAGREDSDYKFVISRFPADSAILADENQQALTVEFLERVFMRSATAYKAALYRDTSFTAGFWLGRAVDKQINNRMVQLPNYWIAEFLASNFRTTAAEGTRRLAVALRDATKRAVDVDTNKQITAAATLASGLAGQKVSIRDVEEKFALSDDAKQAINASLRFSNLVDEQFQFDPTEYKKQIAYRSVELDSGATLTADATKFDDVFRREVLDDPEGTVRYSTEGKVVGETLRKTR
jgi:hypothetical protein